jgi:hypothetical protein
MRQPSGSPAGSRVPDESGASMNSVDVLDPAPHAPVTAPVARPSSRLVRLAREVARFVHDLLTDVP